MAMTAGTPSGEPEAHGPAGPEGGRRGRDGRLRRVWGRRTSRLAVGVVAAAVALTAAAVALGQGIGTFRDVGNDHYARDSVQWAVQNRITVGCRDGTYFCPERTVNRAESVTFLHRYNNNVISSLENRVRTLEGRTTTTPTTPGTGFGNDPATTSTTAPPRKYTTRGDQDDTRSFNLPAGKYDAVLTLEATKAASGHDETGNTGTSGCADGNRGSPAEAVTLIQVEYRDRNSNTWKTYAVRELKLTGEGTEDTNLPGTDDGESLFRRAPAGTATVLVDVENVPGALPLSGYLQVSAYVADNAVGSSCDSGSDPDRTTQYAFDWGLVLTEKRSS